MKKQVGCTPHFSSFGDLSYMHSSSASIAWQSLLLTLILIVRPLHCLTVSCFSVRLSYIFAFLKSLPSFYLPSKALKGLNSHSSISLGVNSWFEVSIASMPGHAPGSAHDSTFFIQGRLSVLYLSMIHLTN